MGKPSAKPTMMRFEPNSGWTEAAEVISINERARTDTPRDIPAAPRAPVAAAAIEPGTTEALVEIGDAMQEVFDSLKINDPRLQAWTQVQAAIRLISGKLQEQQALQQRIAALEAEIDGVRSLAAELVSNAYRNEQEIHETSKLRMQVAESLSEKLGAALKR